MNTGVIIFYLLAYISSRLRYLTHGPSEREGRETETGIGTEKGTGTGIGTEKGTGIGRGIGTGRGRSTMACQRWILILTEAI
jgi:hypothetical protein